MAGEIEYLPPHDRYSAKHFALSGMPLTLQKAAL
jgi:hypothetical protein